MDCRYSFCRVADDLVDNASTAEEALENVARLAYFVCLAVAMTWLPSNHPHPLLTSLMTLLYERNLSQTYSSAQQSLYKRP